MTKKTLISFAFAALLAASAPMAAAKGWEPVKSERQDARRIAKFEEIEIKAAKGAIVVTVSQPTQIKVFTILGQLVAQTTLQPGTHQLSAPHGIYIIKTGDVTCKVAV